MKALIGQTLQTCIIRHDDTASGCQLLSFTPPPPLIFYWASTLCNLQLKALALISVAAANLIFNI